MDNKTLFDQFIQDVLQVDNNRVRLDITGFIDSFGVFITN